MPVITTNFTSRDYTAIYEWLLTILREECPEYTDLNHSDAGIAIIRLIARVSDSLSLYLDMAFAESFVASAKFKQSLIEIARTVDLLPKLPNAATTTIRITRKSAILGNVENNGTPTADIFIPKYTQVYSYDSIPFLIFSDVTIAEGETYKDVLAVQGTHEVANLTRVNFLYDPKTGRSIYNLGKNIADGYTSFTENSVIIWEEVDSFWRSFPEDAHFFLETYADNYNGVSDTIFFTVGNGTQGKALLNSSTYSLDYIRCDGALGNMTAGLINVIASDYDPFVTVTNTVDSSGGSGVEPIEDFRLRIPKVVRTQRRAVTKEDYEALIISVPGIKRVQAIDRNENGIYPWEYVAIYVTPEGGGALTAELYNKVMEACTSKGALGGWYRRYIIKDTAYDALDINCVIGVTYGYDSVSVISSVTTAINSFFHVDNNDIFKVFEIGDLHRYIMAVTGVSWVEFPGLVFEYSPDYGHMTTTGTVTVTVSD